MKVTCPKCGEQVEPFSWGRGRKTCPKCMVRLSIKHVWPEDSAIEQLEYQRLNDQTKGLRKVMKVLQEEVDKKISKLEEKEKVIKSIMMTIWQDNDAPQAEEITMTSLLFC